MSVPSSEVVHVNESLALLDLIWFRLICLCLRVCLCVCVRAVREVRAFVLVGKSKQGDV